MVFRSFFIKAFIVVVFLFANGVYAQSSIKLEDHFRNLGDKYHVAFSYDANLLNPIEITYPDTFTNVESELTFLSSQLPITFERSSAENILIIPVKRNIIIEFVDQKSLESIPLIYFKKNEELSIPAFSKSNHIELHEIGLSDSIRFYSTFYKSQLFTAASLFTGTRKIEMQPNPVLLKETEIKSYMSKGISSRLGDHSIKIELSELPSLAGETDGDVFQVLKSLPGISSPNGKPGSLILRGSTFDQNLFMLDGIPIFHTGHLFGTFSPYNPEVVKTVTVYRNGLPVAEGGRVGGLIDLQMGNKPIDSLHVGLLANLVYGGVTAHVPLVRNKLSVLVSARSTYPFDYRSTKLEALSNLNAQGSRISPEVIGDQRSVENRIESFNDQNFKLIYKPKDNLSMWLSLIRIEDKYGYDFVSSNINRIEYQKSALNNTGASYKIESRIKDKIKIGADASYSNFLIQETSREDDNGIETRNISIENEVTDFRIRPTISYELNKKNEITLGYQYNQLITGFRENFQSSTRPARQVNQNQEANIHAGFLNFENNLSYKLLSKIGLRWSYNDLANQQYIDPRITLTYLVNSNFQLKSSYIQSHQFVKQQFAKDFDDFRISNQYWFLAKGNDEVLKSKQAMFGVLFQKSQWLIDVETYVKDIDGISQTTNRVTTLGGLRTYGTDVLVRKRWNQIDTWISYTLSNTKSTTDTVQDAYFDQTHSIGITGVFPYKKWTLSLSWNFATGLPVHAIDTGLGSPGGNMNTDENQFANDERYPAQHQLDFSLTYKLFVKHPKLNGTIGLSILNLYNQTNIVNQVQLQQGNTGQIRYGVGIAPNIQFNLYWN